MQAEQLLITEHVINAKQVSSNVHFLMLFRQNSKRNGIIGIAICYSELHIVLYLKVPLASTNAGNYLKLNFLGRHCTLHTNHFQSHSLLLSAIDHNHYKNV